MNKSLALASSAPLLLTIACGGGGSSASGGGAGGMQVEVASNGFGKLLPHSIFRADAQGQPTTNLIEIRTQDDLYGNVTADNPVLPPILWQATAQLPNGEPGNHFLYVRFRQPLDVDSVLEPAAGAVFASSLKGTIQVLAYDPGLNKTEPVQGRAFIGGSSYGPDLDPDNPGDLEFERWVELVDGPNGPTVSALIPEAVGFPGTQSASTFGGIRDLVDPRTFLFVVDTDGNLATHETFPAGRQIGMRMTREVRSTSNRRLAYEAFASSAVGSDGAPPEVAIAGTGLPDVVPGNGDIDVDPDTTLRVRFTEPVQPLSVGDLDDGTPPSLGAGIQLAFGPQTARVEVPFAVQVPSVFDLSTLVLIPSYTFPGSAPAGVQASCGNFSQIDIAIRTGQFRDLRQTVNTRDASTFFRTAQAPGLVNAPVAPDAVYIARGGSQPGLSVIDLNGFGAGTGNPTFDPAHRILEGNTNYPNNPNVQLQGAAIFPPLTEGHCTFDGGSPGVFTLAKDSSLGDVVAGFPVLESAGDMALGHSLDGVFNNAAPFGCQAGGGNLCAGIGLKVLQIAAGDTNTLAPAGTSAALNIIKIVTGGENLVSFAPHPNPPPLIFPPLCLAPLIGGQEPSSVDNGVGVTTTGGVIGVGLEQLLKPGQLPLGRPSTETPPDGLLAREQNMFFLGPSRPPLQGVGTCAQYIMRQQIGQFLYVVDRQGGEIVVYNSNRFFVVERISLPDPTSLAMSPDLDLLAVSNQGADLVSFIDVDPSSATFHKVVKSTRVGRGPTGIAWDPGNEDILVCNQLESTLSILSALNLEERKRVQNQLQGPFEVAITPRQLPGLGFSRNVYLAYILNADNSVAVFESGPDGIQGWGFDDVVGRLPFTFQRPKAIQPDHRNLNSAVWIAHENQLSLNGQPTGLPGGAVTNVALTTAAQGQVSLDPGSFGTPNLRDLGFSIASSIGSDQLTGVPVDLAFDNQRNRSALTNFSTPYSAGFPTNVNGKSLVKGNAGTFQSANTPRFMFVAVPNSREGSGVVDVIDLEGGSLRFDTNPFDTGVQSIQASGVAFVMDYFRQ